MRPSATDLRHLDLNLLPVFVALMRERNVTRAGASLLLSQPATSAALARLRTLFRDELFIRNGRNLEPTPRADALAAGLSPALESVSAAVQGSIPFDPAVDAYSFQIGCTGDIILACLPMFRAALQSAPQSRLILHAANFRTIPSLLQTGEISMALGYLGEHLPANVRRRVVRRGGYRVIRDKASSGPVDLATFCARPHVIVTTRGELRDFIDPIIERLGHRREVLVGLPDFALLPNVLRGSQLLCTVNDLLADELVTEGSGLAADLPPFEIPPFTMHIAWRAALDNDPAERWIRARIIEHLARPALK
jgi:LysR family transcriptional activator of mexEF-oprN operon